MPTKYVEVKGRATHFYYTGRPTLPEVAPDFTKGRAVLMVHGAGSNGHTFHYQYEKLGEAHSPIAIDLPGHGRSAGVDGLGSVEEYSDFVIAFADALKLKSFVIAGRSMGGAIAMDVALRYPGRIEALVLIATAPKFNIPQASVDIWRNVTMGRAPQPFTTDYHSPKTVKEHFEIVREGWMEQIQTDPRVRYTDLLACTKLDLRDKIGAIAKPAIVLAGADDKITPPADAEAIAAKIKGARLKTIADAAHSITSEQPGEVNAAIEGFLSELK